MLLHNRVRITVLIFTALAIENLVARVDPHSLVNVTDYHVTLGLGLIVAGLAVRSWAAGTLRKHSQWATTGAYAIVRHPLYIGSSCMMLGFCQLLDDPLDFCFVLIPILLLYLRAVHEEKHIAAAFPNEWPAYAANVPRLVPRRLPSHTFENWRFNQWLVNREYEAVLATLLGLLAMQMWHVIVGIF